ncbi:TIGR00730 family Rossman fold protein [Pullulanibacillus sp. KACC 23026]|uniref:LOG family protein n=1 Tax=Pullulanibacillus sp. KACC 23026 TaxID=3028315 RepID=UPI0023B03882|nr:TIGR00730 family Rossman fold protein [Pullulanibacillus sp. KACC 23026]WEG12308.1 TIGR00730 family Rossman fold protein [Pullulanibacillus sp. KACC 23026]
MKRICVFAGSAPGGLEAFSKHAKELGKLLADNEMEVVYGGSKNGLMGDVANGALAHGGKVTGIMPTLLFQGEIVHTGLTELLEVSDMHERKAKMSELADAYIALPGGYGTFEELFEVLSWSQLGIHKKPIGLLNIENYYTPLIEMIDHAIERGFVKPTHKELVVTADNSEDLINKILTFTRPELDPKWKADRHLT